MSEFLKDRDELLLDLYELLSAGAPIGVTVVQAEELIGDNSPKPPKPYLTYKLISGPTTIGSDENLRRDVGSFVLSSLRSYTVSLQAFGQGGQDALAVIQDNLYAIGIKADGSLNAGEVAKSKGISFSSRQGITNITQVLSTGYEKRFQLDLVFHVANNRTVDITTIDKTTVSGTIEDDNGNTWIVDEQIETP